MLVIDVWWADLTAADISLADTLPDAERTRVLDLDVPADRARRLLGAVLLQHAVATAGGGAPEAPAPVPVDRNCDECGDQHGRPTVAGGPHLTVAHAGVLVVVAACPSARVGVDLERVDRFADQPDPAAAALDWTIREARLKSGSRPGTAHQVHRLEPPLPGYVASLDVASTHPPSIQTHRWPH